MVAGAFVQAALVIVDRSDPGPRLVYPDLMMQRGMDEVDHKLPFMDELPASRTGEDKVSFTGSRDDLTIPTGATAILAFAKSRFSCF